MRLTTLKIEADEDIVRLRMVGQEVARRCGFAKFAETRIVTALLELGRNIVQHGGGGRMTLSLEPQGSGLALGVEAVDHRLVRLSALGEPDGLLVGPRPGRLARLCGREQRAQPLGDLVEERQQPLPRARSLGVLLGRARGSARDHLAPEPLHLGEVPQQVVGVPLRARRHAGRRRGECQHVTEPG